MHPCIHPCVSLRRDKLQNQMKFQFQEKLTIPPGIGWWGKSSVWNSISTTFGCCSFMNGPHRNKDFIFSTASSHRDMRSIGMKTTSMPSRAIDGCGWPRSTGKSSTPGEAPSRRPLPHVGVMWMVDMAEMIYVKQRESWRFKGLRNDFREEWDE